MSQEANPNGSGDKKNTNGGKRRTRRAKPRLFEVAWEVCQQVGGIYTVIRSKAPQMVDSWDGRYCLIGPYNPDISPMEFEAATPTGHIARAIKSLRQQGIEVHYGRWLVTGQPRTILLNYQSVMDRLAEIKYRMWENHHIEIGNKDPLVDHVMAFGYCVEQFFYAYFADNAPKGATIAHFHEWMAGSSIPELRRNNLPLSIVFTTHATMLGRFEAMCNPAFYDMLPQLNWETIAANFNIQAQARLERAAAHGAHLLTTVSDVTADECEHLIGRRPEMLLPNGLNIQRFVAMHEFQNLHLEYKERIHEFVMAHFFPSYTFDLDRTLYFFSSGRFEYRNKGYDVTLEALARLNLMLKDINYDRTIIFFLITRRPFHGINSEVLRRKAMLDELKSNCHSIQDIIGNRLFEFTAQGKVPDLNTLLDNYWRLRLKRIIHARQTHSLPSIITHDLQDDASDEVLNQLRYLNLINNAEDPVKVIYHPDFVEASSPLFGMDYDQFVRGCNLGIFPSFYEPWGYTPLECVARGVPTVTTDQSGFGAYVTKNLPGHSKDGIGVVSRRGRNFDQTSENLADWLLEFCKMERRERIAQRNRVESNADKFDWNVLGQYYDKAHKTVLEMTGM